jgi:pimeloyl-ACP methyl ester carboxylesterase
MAQAKQYSEIEVNGATMAYRELGQGEPMILVHANISDIRSWEPIENKLAEHFRVIVYSRRYAWPNEPILGGEDDPWERHADDLAALIEKLEISPVHVMGNSTGAFIALILARRQPELFRSLILEEPPVLSIFLPSTPPSIGMVLWLLWSQPWSFFPVVKVGATVMGPVQNAFKSHDDEKAMHMFAKGTLGEEFYVKLSGQRIQQMKDNLKPHGALFRGRGLPAFLEDDARRITVRTLLITGEQTSAFHRHANRRLAVLISGAKEVTIPSASHLAHEDNAEKVLEAVSEFLGV